VSATDKKPRALACRHNAWTEAVPHIKE